MEDRPDRVDNHSGDSPEDGKTSRRDSVSKESSRKKHKPFVDDLKKALENQKQVAQSNYEKFLRTYAELENYKKRVEKERADHFKYANEDLLRDMLPFIDNLYRAIEHFSEGDNNSTALAEGVRLTLAEFMRVLEKHGVESIESVGKPFDPNLHEAMLQVETEDYEPLTIVEEFQKGYRLKDRLLRPARVSVAKRPEPDEKESQAEREA
jgi:molecular chaperone GrpE